MIVLVADAAVRVMGIWLAMVVFYVATAVALFVRLRPLWMEQDAICKSEAQKARRYHQDMSLGNKLTFLISMALLLWLLTGVVVVGIYNALTN